MRLRRVDPHTPGITRQRKGRGFSYRDERGERVTDPETLDRIRRLTVPPAWRDVWICPRPNGHIQAVGFDDAGRRQYRYHAAWRVRNRRTRRTRPADMRGGVGRCAVVGCGYSGRR